MENKKLKKRLNDFKHRIRMFGCIYQIMKDEELFYIKDKQLKDSSVKADYIKLSTSWILLPFIILSIYYF